MNAQKLIPTISLGFRFRSFKWILVVSILLQVLLSGCNDQVCDESECGTYPNCYTCTDVTIDAPPAELSEESFKPSGRITETDDGYIIEEGDLEVEMPGGCTFSFLEATDLKVSFGSGGNLERIEGRAVIPSPNDCIEFEDPVSFQLGYYQGTHINDNLDLGFSLPANQPYFLIDINVGLQMNVCTGGGPSSTKPISLKAPVGGHLTYVMDCGDPFVYIEAEQDLLGAFATGASVQGQIGYKALQGDERIEGFSGKSIRKGTISFPYFDILEAEDVVFIQNAEFNADFATGDPLGNISAGYQAGMNGKLKFVLSAGGFLSFTVPVGEASAGIEAVVSTNGVQAKAFVNGLVDPDLSWWPTFLPIKPDGSLRARGFLQQDGTFDLGLEGDIGIEVTGGERTANGSIQVSDQAFSMAGEVTINGDSWGAEATVRPTETELLAVPPAIITNNSSQWIQSSIDDQFEVIDEAKDKLTEALEKYEFELSLKGLRAQLPPMVDEVISLINSAKSNLISDINQAINTELNNRSSKLCSWISDSPTSRVNKVFAKYINALNRLKNAVNDQNDDETAIAELESVLNYLMTLSVVNFDYTFKVKATKTWLPCTGASSVTISKRVKRTITILNGSRLSLLQQAADNVKFIPPARGVVLDAQIIVNALPTDAELNQLKQDLQNGVVQISSIGGAGYVKDKNTGEFEYFVLYNGSRKTVSQLDPFDESGLGGGIISALLK